MRIEGEVVRREGAGLVGAEHVDAGHRFDGAEPLHEDAAPAHRDRADEERDRRRQDEPLRDHRRDRRRDPANGVVFGKAEPVPAGEMQKTQADRGVAQPGDDPVDGSRRRTRQEPKATGLHRDAVREGGRPDGVGAVLSLAGGADAAGKERLAELAADGVGLAGEESLIDLEGRLREDRPVRDDRVAGGQLDAVAADDVARRDLDAALVPDHADPALDEETESIEMPLGPEFLDESEARIEDRHAADGDGASDVAEQAERDGRGGHHRVEAGEEIADQDAEIIARAGAAAAIDLAPTRALGRLGGRSVRSAFSPSPRFGERAGVRGAPSRRRLCGRG